MKYVYKLICFIIISQQLYGSPIFSHSAIHHPVIGENGMVSTQEKHATQIGIDILKNGGNAIDAAVGVGFALAVTLPQAGNLGGGGFMLIYIASENRQIALDFREMAPEKASRDMFLNDDGNVIKEKSRFSIYSVGVPGSVDGLLYALDKFGTMPQKTIIKPSIKLAKNGIKVSNELAESLKNAKKRLIKDPYLFSIFYPNESTPKVGSKLIQKDLAKSLSLISKNGRGAFYNGKIGKNLIKLMKIRNGLITKSDLNNYQTKVRTPITGKYRNHTIVSMPPPSSGGVTLIQLLKLIEPYPIKKWGHNSSKTIHVMAEAMQLVYADRAHWLGDEDFSYIPKNEMLRSSYIDTHRKKISLKKHRASEKTTHGIPYESNETTHYSIIDKWGNAVSVTTTLNFSYGSSIGIPGTGIILNNQMDDFSSKPGVPNAYGLIGSKRNQIDPKKRMLSSMTPTFVFRNNKLFLVTGSPGGSRIITTVAQIISNTIDHNLNIAEATHAARFHHQWLPDELRLEKTGFSKDTIKELKLKGHNVVFKRAMGSTQSIIKNRNILYGSSDPRKPSALTLGY